jgi:hypothetical protein
MGKLDPYEIEVVALHETEKGLLVVPIEYFEENHRDIPKDLKRWLPKSQILDTSEVTEKGDNGVLIIPQWLAEQCEWE